MSITRLDIKDQCFGVSQLSEVTELALTNRGIHDLGCLARECPSLTELNLGFNALVTLQGLGALTSLVKLNLSHNQLVALKGMGTLTSLTSLNISHNKVSSISGLSTCSGLRDLWVQSNQIKQANELSVFSSLSSLERLVFSPNPICKSLAADAYRPLIVALSPSLQGLDGLPVTDADRQAASAINVQDHIASSTATPFVDSGPRSVGSEVGRQRHSAPASTCGSMPGSPAQPARNGLPGQRGRLPARAPGLPRPVKPLLSDTGVQPLSLLSQGGLPLQQDSTAEMDGTLSSARSDDDLMSLLSDASTLGSGRGRRKTQTSKHIPRIKELPAGSQFNAALAMLPTIDTSKLPQKYSPTKVMATLPRKQPPPKPPPEAAVVMGELKYPAGSRGRAVTVLGDGSATSCWPNSSMAVNVDANHATSPPTYSMFACYQSGNIAVSWDAAGGFVQYPSGAVCINYSSSTGAGTLFATNGDVLLKWRDDEGSSASPSQGAPPVDMALDANYGVRFSRAARCLELYMSCEGVRFKFLCARNSLNNTWDAPGSKGRTSRHTGLQISAASQEAGEGEAGGGGAEAGAQGLCPNTPPPAFLQQLVAGSTAGATQVAMAKAISGGPSGTGDQAAVSEDASSDHMSGVAADAADAMAAVTRALRALDAGLFKGLASGL